MTAVIIPCSVNPKYPNLIVGNSLGFGLTLINHEPNLRPNPNPNPNLVSNTKFVHLGFTDHGIITIIT